MRRVISASLLATMTVGLLGGCSNATTEMGKIPLVSALSVKEVKDYYKASLSYDSIAKRTSKVNEITYDAQIVDGDNKQKAIKAATEIESKLARNTMNPLAEKKEMVSVFNYIKTVLDDKQLKRTNEIDVTEALGHYFVDITYSIAPRASGSFNENLKYYGLNGGFIKDINNNVIVDKTYIDASAKSIEKFKKDNPDYKSPKKVAGGVRSPLVDVNLYNKAAGQSLTQSAAMPMLSQIYNIPAETGGIAGFGIYPQGAFTLSDFGYSRAKMNGTATIRYVFKKNLMNPQQLDFRNAYVYQYKINNEPKLPEERVVVPTFIEGDLAQIVERADRAISNNDLSALMGGNIFEDVGPAVVYGNLNEHSYNQKHMTKIVDILDRKGNSYLVSIEQTLQEAPKGVEATGTYVDKGYMVIQQVDTDFHITDYAITERTTLKEPQINIDDTILQQLASMNLTGKVSDESKAGIGEFMKSYYTACTNRKLDAMNSSFNDDVEILSSTKFAYLTAQVRGWLTKAGADVPCTYNGMVVEWLGGSENQVEMITQELLNYEGKDKGQYMRNYYLLSSHKDKWVIDDLKVIESKQVVGEELARIKTEIENDKSFIIEDADNELKEESEGKVKEINNYKSQVNRGDIEKELELEGDNSSRVDNEVSGE